jgi:hypothetical protein
MLSHGQLLVVSFSSHIKETTFWICIALWLLFLAEDSMSSTTAPVMTLVAVILSWLHAVFSLARVVCHYTLRAPFIRSKTLPSRSSFFAPVSSSRSQLPTQREKLKALLKFGVALVTDKAGLFNIAYVITSFLAVILNIPALYCFHLFDIILRDAVLSDTLASVSKYFRVLASTLCLLFVLVFTFSQVGLASFPEDFPPGGFGNASSSSECDSRLNCFVFFLNFGLRAGGGIGDIMKGGTDTWSDGQEGSQTPERAFFDVLFYFIIPLVMISIVSGIIIDAFGASRDERQLVNEDQTRYCFICGLEASKFDRAGKGFKKHVKYAHHMWDYVDLIAYLCMKDAVDMTGQESFVMERIRARDISWMPQGDALELCTC